MDDYGTLSRRQYLVKLLLESRRDFEPQPRWSIDSSLVKVERLNLGLRRPDPLRRRPTHTNAPAVLPDDELWRDIYLDTYDHMYRIHGSYDELDRARRSLPKGFVGLLLPIELDSGHRLDPFDPMVRAMLGWFALQMPAKIKVPSWVLSAADEERRRSAWDKAKGRWAYDRALGQRNSKMGLHVLGGQSVKEAAGEYGLAEKAARKIPLVEAHRLMRRLLQDLAVFMLHQEGESISAIAAWTDLSEDTVRRIVKSGNARAGSMELFPAIRAMDRATLETLLGWALPGLGCNCPDCGKPAQVSRFAKVA